MSSARLTNRVSGFKLTRQMKRPAPDPEDWFAAPEAPFELWMTLDYPHGSIELEWIHAASGVPETKMRVRLTNSDELAWEWEHTQQLAWRCRVHGQAVRGRLDHLRKMFPSGDALLPGMIPVIESGAKPKAGGYQALDLPLGLSPWRWL
ncbi:MAG TPA: hypothetical protein VNO52_05370, partial [Methylomirabilota bacterium]|nr:hypothetical protein [Methylomirabilota bacterium]